MDGDGPFTRVQNPAYRLALFFSQLICLIEGDLEKLKFFEVTITFFCRSNQAK